MNVYNIIGVLFGVTLILCGLFGEGRFYNRVEVPLNEEDLLKPPKPFTKGWRILYVGFGGLLVALGFMGKFNP